MSTPDESSPAPIRVFVVDDHEMVRRGLAAFLSAVDDFEWAGEAAGRLSSSASISGTGSGLATTRKCSRPPALVTVQAFSWPSTVPGRRNVVSAASGLPASKRGCGNRR